MEIADQGVKETGLKCLVRSTTAHPTLAEQLGAIAVCSSTQFTWTMTTSHS